MAYYDFLNLVFSPLIGLPPLLAIILLSLLVSLIIILITKYTTDQVLMKRLKEEIKGYQKQIKESRDNPSKAMELQKKAMEVNMRYMTHSLKPTIITFIPIILIFGWMSSIFAYDGIMPQQEFSVTAFFDKNSAGNATLTVSEGLKMVSDGTQKIENGRAAWSLKGENGEHSVEVVHDTERQQKSIFITDDNKYAEPIKKFSGSRIKSIQVNYQPKKLLNIFGWKLGWLGTYIIFSIAFTMALRKIMKVY